MKNWTKAWKASTKPSKQRKYVYQTPLHLRTTLMSSHLSKELQKKYGMRNISLKKGDKVKIMRGQYTGATGKVQRLDRMRIRVYVEGVDRSKMDGSKSLYGLHPSKVMIIDLFTEDKRRMKRGKTK